MSYNLPGNETLAENIRRTAARGALSHALLLTGLGDRLAAARFTAAAMECTSEGEKPCGICIACQKVLRDIHPDVITVRDDSRKNLSVEVVRAARADAWIQPNEGARKIYIFPDCTLLTEEDQNILLKTVEEGPPYAAFLFCAEHASAALPTLRSRCVELKLHPAEEAASVSQEFELAQQLCRILAEGRPGTAAELLFGLDQKRTAREAVEALLRNCQTLLSAALLTQHGCGDRPEVRQLADRLSSGQLLRILDVLGKYQRQCAAYQVNTALVLGALAVELEELF